MLSNIKTPQAPSTSPLTPQCGHLSPTPSYMGHAYFLECHQFDQLISLSIQVLLKASSVVCVVCSYTVLKWNELPFDIICICSCVSLRASFRLNAACLTVHVYTWMRICFVITILSHQPLPAWHVKLVIEHAHDLHRFWLARLSTYLPASIFTVISDCEMLAEHKYVYCQ